MKSMYGRQFATMAGMILLSFLMLGASFATLSYQYTIKDKQDSMGRSASIIAAYTSAFINENGEYSWREDVFICGDAGIGRISGRPCPDR